ncbi:hypothetical protein DFH11DRAFT_1513749, partial [Phellopilus nigrolimitatus]
TSQGTSNLKSGAEICDQSRGVVAAVARLTGSAPPYSLAAHRALIALRAAKSHRPFNFVTDPHYKLEVEMLRPGTIIPHPTTVSRDINTLYVGLSNYVKDYFTV